uniref:RH2 domain-containing protein n=1 Tax=Ditylenchus dipsaci TaxID=166011 RepID=A0A915E2I6_9BILA
MPLVVNVLENLDLAYLEKEEHLVDLEMLKEENEQVLNQFERERQMRKNQDQKCLEMEESLVEQNRELESKIESLESIVRMLELKSKNASDHANRLEEREADQKVEYEKLHERYNELLRTHIEHVERTKFLMGAEMFDMAQSLPMNVKNRSNMAMSVIDSNVRGISDLISAVHMSQSTHADVNLANHISSERDWQEEFGQQSAAEILQSPRQDEAFSKEQLEEDEEDSKSLKEPSRRPSHSRTDQLSAAVDDGDAISLGADLTGQLVDPAEFASAGMGREVENLIKENTELLETKNALNIVKNDLIARVDELSSEHEIFKEEVRSLEMVKLKMSEKIRELEGEIKELKEKKNLEEAAEEQEDIPMAQRKRFTRVEMARVLMERNQYKEKLIELQDALKFTEMQRAKKMTSSQPAGKTGIWDFFSNLFGESSSQRPVQSSHGHRKVTKKSSETAAALNRKAITRNFDIDMDSVQEKRMSERRQQYKAVSQHMKKEDESRTQAYGWSIPSTVDTASVSASIPVPVCCRPLLDRQPSLKIWCAASVALHGGKTKDGNFIVGDPLLGCDPSVLDPLNTDLTFKNRSDWSLNESSSLIWCFVACSSHLLCIASVAGVHESEVRVDEDFRSKLTCDGGYLKEVPIDIGDCDSFGAVYYVQLRKMDVTEDVPTYCAVEEHKPSPKRNRDFSINSSPPEDSTGTEDDAENEKISPSSAGNMPLHIRETLNKYEQVGEKNSALPTMWMGLENEFIYVHSAVVDWKTCLMKIKMPDAVLHILHLNGRVFAALANGSIVVFHRDADGNWSDSGYNIVQLGKATNSVCHLINVNGKIWAAYRNCVVVINPDSLKAEHVFVAHPRRDSQVRHMVSVDQGVWLSIRLDSTIRLYHSQTYQHLQDVDIEPYITKMLGTNKLDFLHLRITSLVVLNKRLWIGTGTGVIISVPLSEDNNAKIDVSMNSKSKKEEPQGPGGLIRVYGGSTQQGHLTNSGSTSTIPYCNMTQAQLSFHGHKDSVRFFLPVVSDGLSDLTQTLESRKLLMISGGDGYIDFRLGEDEEPTLAKEQVRVRDMSHLIVWEVEQECQVHQPSEKKLSA